jgi:hypothetical protein
LCFLIRALPGPDLIHIPKELWFLIISKSNEVFSYRCFVPLCLLSALSASYSADTVSSPTRRCLVPSEGSHVIPGIHWPLVNALQPLAALPAIRLGVLERKTRSALIGPSLPAYPAVAAGKQDAPQSNSSEEGAYGCTKPERHYTRLCPHGVGVECICGVEETGYGECG